MKAGQEDARIAWLCPHLSHLGLIRECPACLSYEIRIDIGDTWFLDDADQINVDGLVELVL
jgi:hypothetical protein